MPFDAGLSNGETYYIVNIGVAKDEDLAKADRHLKRLRALDRDKADAIAASETRRPLLKNKANTQCVLELDDVRDLPAGATSARGPLTHGQMMNALADGTFVQGIRLDGAAVLP